jgi:hypothetical protein
MLRLVSVGSIEEFQWSEDEQVWPFERAEDGSTLYCKKIDGGFGPNAGTKAIAHGIDSIGDNYYNSYAFAIDSFGNALPLPHGGDLLFWYYVRSDVVHIGAPDNRTSNLITIKIIYAKSS